MNSRASASIAASSAERSRSCSSRSNPATPYRTWAIQRIRCSSRNPPLDSFRLGSSRWALDPNLACSAARSSSITSTNLSARRPRVSLSILSRNSPVNQELPKMWRPSSRAVCTERSRLASVTHSTRVRRLEPSTSPASQRSRTSRLHSSSAPCLAPGRYKNIRSTSEKGDSSARPYPPNATNAISDSKADASAFVNPATAVWVSRVTIPSVMTVSAAATWAPVAPAACDWPISARLRIRY